MDKDEDYIRERITVLASGKQSINAPIQVQISPTRAYYAYSLIRREMDNRRPSIRNSYRGTTMSELQLNEKIGQSMIGLVFAGFLVKDAFLYNNKVRFKLELQADPDDIELEIKTSFDAEVVHNFGG